MASFFDHPEAERGAFRFIFLEPLIGKLRRREYLEMVDVANFLVSVDIDPNSVRRLKFVKSFIKLARFLLCFEEMRKLGIIIIALVVLSATVRGHPHFVLRPTGPLPAVNVP